ncbi:MAG: hypothetical protein ACYC9S_01700 [Leptospirales bacterium]
MDDVHRKPLISRRFNAGSRSVSPGRDGGDATDIPSMMLPTEGHFPGKGQLILSARIATERPEGS